MRILKKKITYKGKQYIVKINECLHVGDDYIDTCYEVTIRKPYHFFSEITTTFEVGTSITKMIYQSMDNFIIENNEIDKIKEWDGVINEL